jgi:hypothetical protein
MYENRPKCSSCNAFHPSQADPARGECRRHAPSSVQPLNTKESVTRPPCPMVTPDYGCCEHQDFPSWWKNNQRNSTSTNLTYDPKAGYDCSCVMVGRSLMLDRVNIMREDGGFVNAKVHCPTCHGTGKVSVSDHEATTGNVGGGASELDRWRNSPSAHPAAQGERRGVESRVEGRVGSGGEGEGEVIDGASELRALTR